MMQAANHVRQAQRSGLRCKQHAASRQHSVALGIMAGSNAGRRTLVIRAAGETMAPDSYCCVVSKDSAPKQATTRFAGQYFAETAVHMISQPCEDCHLQFLFCGVLDLDQSGDHSCLCHTQQSTTTVSDSHWWLMICRDFHTVSQRMRMAAWVMCW